jgi:ATPase subunit of ABC transporter with duplicated ATPase domains
VLLLDEPTEALDAPTAARLLAGVRDFDPRVALVITLHDRQSLVLPWTPSARVELTGTQYRDTLSRTMVQG